MGRSDVLSAAAGASDHERRLRLVIEATPNAMVMVDVEGQIVLVNSQTEALFGYSRDELLAMRLERLIPERFRDMHRVHRRGFFAHPDTRAMGAGRDLYGLRSDGTEVPIEIGLNPLETDEGVFVLASIIDITERKRSEERLLHVVEAAPNAMIMVNDRAEIVLVNSQAERSFGYPRAELLSMHVEDLIPERFRGQHRSFRDGFFANPDRREMGVGRELFGRRSDGSEMPIEIGLNPIQIAGENFVLASVIDITERLVSQAAANATREDHLRRSILDTLPFSIIATDAGGRIVTANPAAEKLLGYRQRELVGTPLHEIHGGNQNAHATADGLDLREVEGGEREWVYVRKDGTRVPVNEAVAPMTTVNGEAGGYLTVAYDITTRIEAQAEVMFLANHDALTNLPNRTMLVSHLDRAIADAERDGTEVAVLLLDVDHFKRVNDSLGHHVGDELLLSLVDRLKACTREGDMVARLGGDEFVLVFNRLRSATDVTPRVRALMDSVTGPVVVHGHELVVTASVGGAGHPGDGTTPSTLLQHADTAMYHAKSAGRNNFQWFSDSMLDESNDKISLATALRQALREQELSIAYQPQVNLRTGKVVGVEALARWNRPGHGDVPPDRFIPVAEDSGMIVELGGWILKHACREAAAIQQSLGKSVGLAVNVSPRQFRSKDWVSEIVDALNESGFDPRHLELEITEGILMDDHGEVIDILRAIRKLGVKIVVDDFGRGYSSLAYLTRFPVDKIKIDRSFVQSLTRDTTSAPIIDAIIVMAHTLGITVVAEGVETEAQESYLRERDCDEAQGFLYRHAVPAADLPDAAHALDARCERTFQP